MLRTILLSLALVASLTACSEEDTTCPSYASCRWTNCNGRRFTSCGACPGGAIDTRVCGAQYDGGAPDVVATCENTPCLRPNVCHANDCAGPVVYRGCCDCPAATVEHATCPVDAGADVLDAD